MCSKAPPKNHDDKETQLKKRQPKNLSCMRPVFVLLHHNGSKVCRQVKNNVLCIFPLTCFNIKVKGLSSNRSGLMLEREGGGCSPEKRLAHQFEQLSPTHTHPRLTTHK